MKKIFTSVLGLATLFLCSSVQAENITVKTSDGKSTVTGFFNQARTAESNDTLFLVYNSEKPTMDIGNYTQEEAGAKGRLVIWGTPGEDGTLPILKLGWNFPHNEAADHFCIEFHNVNLQYRAGASATSGQIFYDNCAYNTKEDKPNAKLPTFFDEFIIDNCEMTEIPRTLFRNVPAATGEVRDESNNVINDNYGAIGLFQLTNSKYHMTNLTKGNKWSVLCFGSPVGELIIRNNTFYDMPYVKQIVEFSRVNKEYVDSNDATIVIENNDFFMANNLTNNFFGFDNNIGQMSNYTFRNNLFMRPTWIHEGAEADPGNFSFVSDKDNAGTLVNVRPTQDVKDDDGNVIGTEPRQQQIFRASYGLVTAENNIIDETYRESNEYGWTNDVLLDGDGEGAWLEDNTTPGILPETAGFSWDNMPLASDGDFTRGATSYAAVNNIGNPNMIGQVKTKAIVNVKVEGSKSAVVTVNPEKSLYFVGDEVTLSVDLKNTPHLAFNKFVKWEDGSTTVERTVTLGETNDFVATVEETEVYAAFTFPTVPAAGQNKAELFTADHLADGVTATAQLMFAPEGEDYRLATADDGRFQWRGAKFGEDDLDQQIPVLSRRTLPASRLEGHMDFVLFTISTTDASNITFSCYVGTDNYACKKQLAEYSIDGGTTWKALASVELTERAATFGAGEGQLYGWDELKGTLPAEAENKEAVLIRVIGDVTGEMVFNTAAGELDNETANTFEYLGEVLITATTTNSIETIGLDGKAADANAPVYNILGQRVVNPAAGQLYIKSGKKFFVK
jgi:hypothetical protein